MQFNLFEICNAATYNIQAYIMQFNLFEICNAANYNIQAYIIACIGIHVSHAEFDIFKIKIISFCIFGEFFIKNTVRRSGLAKD